MEPHVAALAGLHSPTTAITDYRGVAHALCRDIQAAGGDVLVGAEATRVRVTGSTVRVTASGEERELDRLVICAGLQSDRVARSAGDEHNPTIRPLPGVLPDRDRP